MNKINLAILGLGRIGKVHAENIISLNECNLKIIIDPVSDFDNNFTDLGIKQSKHFDALLNENDIDGVIICSPSKYHVSQIKSLSDLTKNIFCEKPLGLSIEEILDVKSLVTKKSLNLHIGFNRRYDPDFSELKRHILNNEIGDLHMIKITSRDPAPPPISYIKKSGGIFLDMTIHDFDMVKYLSGSEIAELYVKGGCFVDPEIEKANDVDTAIINMSLKNGVLATINNSRQAVYGYDQRIEVLGSKGVLKVENKLLNKVVKGTKEGFISSNPQNFFIDRYEQSYKKELLNFVQSIKGDIVDYADADDGLHALKAGLAANNSLLNNTPFLV
ncbi:inositol 2-dehydrogenase [Candidatus Marinimicrobia bacterium]|nr:inositol 2-dehydrogenase [Candidatus Neomarinimicrobiota bacterium]MDC3333580.1 inositol 2-dehydrogenase [Candidatus Neomarinimicrobiota bacterium]